VLVVKKNQYEDEDTEDVLDSVVITTSAFANTEIGSDDTHTLDGNGDALTTAAPGTLAKFGLCPSSFVLISVLVHMHMHMHMHDAHDA
jgi:hypothetical protein